MDSGISRRLDERGWPAPPKYPSDEYRWWQAGAVAEARERNRDLTDEQMEIRDCLLALAQNSRLTAAELAVALIRIYCPWRLKRKYRRP